MQVESRTKRLSSGGVRSNYEKSPTQLSSLSGVSASSSLRAKNSIKLESASRPAIATTQVFSSRSKSKQNGSDISQSTPPANSRLLTTPMQNGHNLLQQSKTPIAQVIRVDSRLKSKRNDNSILQLTSPCSGCLSTTTQMAVKYQNQICRRCKSFMLAPD